MSPRKKIPPGVLDVIIIGGGPAGLTAGLYAARARLNTFLVESLAFISQARMTEVIENYPGIERMMGPDLLSAFKKQAQSFGLDCRFGTVSRISSREEGGVLIWQVEDESGVHEALSVIVATGAVAKRLGVPGETKFIGKGISYCAVCDAKFFQNRHVVVVGGGNTAIEEALFLTRFVKKITLVHRRDRLRAAKVLQEEIFANKKVEFIWDSVVEEISGSDTVEKVRLKNVKTGEKSDFPCEGVFVFVGWRPNTDIVKGLAELDERGCIKIDHGLKTSQEGIFACGDCCSKTLHQVVTACGDGATAAYSVQKYVEEVKGITY